MGFFGGQKQDPPAPAFEPDAFEEAFDSLPPLPKPQENTVIAQGITFNGVVQGEGVVRIEGRLEGEIKLSGSVTVATTGSVVGPISADTVRVAGQVEGSITARDSLCLERTGSIHGDVSTASLMIENGRLNGSSTMLAPIAPPPEPEVASQDLQFGDSYAPLEDLEAK